MAGAVDVDDQRCVIRRFPTEVTRVWVRSLQPIPQY